MGQEIQELKLDSKNRRKIKSCPCGKSNKDGKFVPYSGYDEHGFCHSCSRTFLPNSGTLVDISKIKKEQPQKPTWNYLKDEVDIFLGGYYQNNLITWLKKFFTLEQIDKVITDYLIGTSGYWNGATVLFQHDLKNKCRYGKVIQFDSETGKTIKEPRRKTIRLATTLKLKTEGYQIKQCLFGLHLADMSEKVFLVESEKTAIVFALKYPDALVMATGGKGGLKYDYLKPIKNKNIVAFPDADGAEQWKEQALTLSKYGFKLDVVDVVSDYGLSGNDDILDFWIREEVLTPVYHDAETALDLLIDEFDLVLESKNKLTETDYLNLEIDKITPTSPKEWRSYFELKNII